MSLDFDTSILGNNPQQILSLSMEQYETMLRLYNEQEESGIDNATLKTTLNALTYDIINTHVESMCGLNVIGRGEFTQFEALGSGAFAFVVKVPHLLQVQSPVAVKCLRNIHNGDKRACLRWVRESRIWKEMRHFNIVPLLGVWINFYPRGSRLPAFVMPLMDTTLRKYLDSLEGSATPVKKRIRWMCEVVDALNYMHNHKLRVAHGDLCAANILLQNNSAKICDFGLSRTQDGVSNFTTSSTRNADWIAPERRSDINPTLQSDMYEYGITFVEVTAGRTPWDGLKGIGLLIRRFSGSTIGTPTRPPGMPDTVWDFVQSCTRINEKERIKSYQALRIVQNFVASGIDWPLTPW